MKLEIYTEEEWFNTFYPYPDWKERFVIKNGSGVCWFDYELTGRLEKYEKGKYKVIPVEYNEYRCMDNFFIECGDNNKQNHVAWFIQPYYQNKTKKYYARITVNKEESNLDLYKIYVVGDDDSSYTKHLIGMDNVNKELERLKTEGIWYLTEDKNSGFFFTN